MKRTITRVLTLALFLTAAAFSQEEPAKQPVPKSPMPGQGRMGMRMQQQGGPNAAQMMLPGLTPEQRKKMTDLRLAHQKETLPLRTQLGKLAGDLKLEITAEKFNEGKVKSIQAEIAKLRNEMETKAVFHKRAVRDLLDADQKTMFDQKILSGGGPMGAGRGLGVERMGRMGAGRGMGVGPMGKMGAGRGMGMGGRMMGRQGRMMGRQASMPCPCMR